MNAESTPHGRMPLLVKLTLALAGLLVLLLLALFVWRMLMVPGNARRLAAIKAAGEPATARELDSWYAAVDDKENAGLHWLAAMNKCVPPIVSGQPVPWSAIKLPARGQKLPPADAQRALEILKANQEALGLFRQAAALPASRYPVDLSQASFADLSHLSMLRAAVSLLQLEALLQAENGRGAEAAASIHAMLGAGRSLAQEPLFISQLTRAALDHLAGSATERALHLTSLTDPQLAALQAAFAAAETPNLSTRALIGERACTATILHSPDQLTPPNNPQAAQSAIAAQRGFGSSLMRASGFFQRDLAFFLDAMSTNIALSSTPDPGPARAGATMDALARRARSGYYIMSGLTLPSLARATDRDASHRARLRVVQAALASERYRLANGGRIPATLEALVPKYLAATPVDPFTGEALLFKARPRGYVVYSVGEDGTDDDGTPLPSGSPARKPPHDIPFVIER